MKTIPIPEGMQTAVFVMESGALKDSAQVVKEYFPGKTPWIVADGNTWEAAGKKVAEVFQAAGLSMKEPHIFPAVPQPHPYESICQELSGKITGEIVPVAVGSGVINDLVKRASGIAGVRYFCVATAASVDGYTAAGAALSVDGLKKTMPCPAPYAVLADTDVLKSAPAPMMAAGYADLFAKVVAGAEWKVSDLLGILPIDKKAWDLVQKNLRMWLEDSSNLGYLFDGLASTGYSMQVYNDSRPASGMEHLMSHVWEMEGLTCNGADVSHGFKVGIGTLAAIRLMEFVIGLKEEEARKLAKPCETLVERQANVKELLKKNCYGNPEKITFDKFKEGDAALERRELIFRNWDRIRHLLKGQIFSYAETRRLLQEAKAPVNPREIGLDKEQFYHGLFTAQLIRARYTFLDLLYEAGLLEEAAKTLDIMFEE